MAINEDLPILVTLARLPRGGVGVDREILESRLSPRAKRIAAAIYGSTLDPKLAEEVRAVCALAGVEYNELQGPNWRTATIDILKDAGYTTSPRDWAMGQTIFVTHEALRQEYAGPVVAYRDVVYVLRNTDGTWITTTKTGEYHTVASFEEVQVILKERLLSAVV